MKLGIIGTGNVGCAIALTAVARGSAREICARESHQQDGGSCRDRHRYGTPLSRSRASIQSLMRPRADMTGL
jgi:L-lactate dehydrogenase